MVLEPTDPKSKTLQGPGPSQGSTEEASLPLLASSFLGLSWLVDNRSCHLATSPRGSLNLCPNFSLPIGTPVMWDLGLTLRQYDLDLITFAKTLSPNKAISTGSKWTETGMGVRGTPRNLVQTGIKVTSWVRSRAAQRKVVPLAKRGNLGEKRCGM